jgi:hypothetical protein
MGSFAARQLQQLLMEAAALQQLSPSLGQRVGRFQLLSVLFCKQYILCGSGSGCFLGLPDPDPDPLVAQRHDPPDWAPDLNNACKNKILTQNCSKKFNF